MLISELFESSSEISVTKKISAILNKLPADKAKALKDNKNIIGNFTFASENQKFVWRSTAALIKPTSFSRSLTLAAKEFKRHFGTDYVTLVVTKADIYDL